MFCKTKKIFVLCLLLIAVFVCGFPDLSGAAKKHLVVIDPAHGGQDSGVKITDKISEKEVTLLIALAIQKELAKDDNIEVVLTRDADKTISLEDRKKGLSKIKPDLFLSLHINSGFGKNAGGFELYYPGFSELTDTKKQSKSVPKDIKNKYLNESVRMAQIIQKNMETIFPRKGRGLREAGLPVLEGMDIPAVVVEMGFASNPEERKKLLAAKSQSEIAKVLTKSIKSFF